MTVCDAMICSVSSLAQLSRPKRLTCCSVVDPSYPRPSSSPSSGFLSLFWPNFLPFLSPNVHVLAFALCCSVFYSCVVLHFFILCVFLLCFPHFLLFPSPSRSWPWFCFVLRCLVFLSLFFLLFTHILLVSPRSRHRLRLRRHHRRHHHHQSS